MDRKSTEIAKFLLDWSSLLVKVPVEGSIPEIYFCFISSVYSKGKDKVSWLQFIKYLNLLQLLANGGLFTIYPSNVLKIYDDPFKCFAKITDINRLALGLLLNKGYELTTPMINFSEKFNGNSINAIAIASIVPEIERKENNLKCDESQRIPNCEQSISANKEDQLDLLLNLIDGESSFPIKSDNDVYPVKLLINKRLIPQSLDDTYTLTSKNRRLHQMEYLLNTPSASHSLQRERARIRTEIKPFYETCEESDHATLLTNLVTFDKVTNICKINDQKFKKMERSFQNKNFISLSKCIQNKLHFIPIVQPQTDLKLGDCSYLDTCHKMSICRYTHYGQLMPTICNDANAEISKHKDEIEESMRIWDFTRGEPTSLFTQKKLPAQWINCDLTKLDFSVLGNDFGVVIADPSWTIHMNLNYSSMKDDELLSLRMDKLQREGIFLLWVTGRTIETGRHFLQQWGYEVVNQMTWIKTSQLVRTISTGRTGHWLNHSKEHLLLGIKGNPKWLNKGMDPQILISSTRETSRKPDEIYGVVERIVGDGTKKLEIFGRQHNTRPGWLTVGNQLDGTHLIQRDIAERYERWLSSQ